MPNEPDIFIFFSGFIQTGEDIDGRKCLQIKLNVGRLLRVRDRIVMLGLRVGVTLINKD